MPPPGRKKNNGDAPEIARRQFRGFRLDAEKVIGLYRQMVIGMVADTEGDVAGKEVVAVPGMLGGGPLVLAVVLLAHQAVMLYVID